MKTVKELKEAIKNIPDDYVIDLVCSCPKGCSVDFGFLAPNTKKLMMDIRKLSKNETN